MDETAPHDRSEPPLFGPTCSATRLLHLVRTVLDERHPTRLDRLVPLAAQMVANDGGLAESTRTVVVTEITRFGRHCAHLGIDDLTGIDPAVVASYLHAPVTRSGRHHPPARSTSRNRRNAVRHLYRTLRRLGYTVADRSADLDTPIDRSPSAGFCDDLDIARLRRAAPYGLFPSLLSIVLALAEAGATNGEIAQVRGHDIEGDRVRLPGGHRLDPRENPLTAWGAAAIADRLTRLDHPDQALMAATPDATATPVSVSNAFAHICAQADLADRQLRIDSVRAWAARQVLHETGSIESAARFAGLRSLDAAVELTGHHWRADP